MSTAGYFQLTWSDPTPAPDSGDQFELQQATQADFSDAVTRYQGSDQATVISGLADQTYYYRVRHSNLDDWSNGVTVQVKHHSLARAFSFFGLGLVMFIVTLTVLLKGAHKHPGHDHA